MKNTPTDNLITEAVNKWSDTVFRIAFQYVKSRADAEDVLQDVFLQLLRKPPATDNENAIKAWLIRVTINKSRDYYRQAKRRREFVSSYSPPPEKTVHDEVFEAVRKLNEKDRTFVYLHYYEGYTAREIADITGASERAITKRIARAREKLKDFLKE